METTSLLHLSTLQISIVVTLLLAFVTQTLYQVFYLTRFKKIRKINTISTAEPVSIVICSKNEAHYLRKHLPRFLDQDYPEFEVIIVNDGCIDETEHVVELLQKQYANLRMTKIPLDDKFQHNKKLAQTIGIKAAKYEKILFSNADCKPINKKWLKNVMNSWINGVHIGYANFENQKGFKTNLMKFDLLQQSIKRGSFSSMEINFSGNGNNLGYSKTDFFSNKGFARHAHFEAGYDHLMVFQLGKMSGTSIALSPETKIILSSEKMATQWSKFNQHYYHSKKYLPFKIRFLVDIEPLSQLLFYTGLLLALFFTKLYLLIGLLILLRIILLGSYFKIQTSHLKEENLFLSSYVYGILTPILKLFLFSKNLIFSKR